MVSPAEGGPGTAARRTRIGAVVATLTAAAIAAALLATGAGGDVEPELVGSRR